MSGYPRHGHSVIKKSSTYISWVGMKQRCLYKNGIGYENYGGRGISICNEWLIFDNFLRDMGDRPCNTSLERKDSNGNYCKENCRWATPIEQANNTRRNVVLTMDGKSHTVAEWSRITGIEESLIRKRIDNLRWSVEKTLTTKADQRFNKNKLV